LLEWNPPGEWWQNKAVEEEQLGEEYYRPLKECFQTQWESYQRRRRQRHNQDAIKDTDIIASYPSEGAYNGGTENDKDNVVVLMSNVLTETELVALESLGDCAYQILPKEWPHYQRRTDIGTGAQYTEHGAHECVYLQGLLQLFAPGVVASLTRAVHHANLGTRQLSSKGPSLGIRTAEYLLYGIENQVGWHEDTGSIRTISLAFTNATDYQGGEFRIIDNTNVPAQGFKVDRGSAIVFDSTANHSVAPMTAGHRRVMVLEYWEDDDAPVGLPRPHPTTFARWKRGEPEKSGSGTIRSTTYS
jgi:hypothetical protein